MQANTRIYSQLLTTVIKPLMVALMGYEYQVDIEVIAPTLSKLYKKKAFR